ncbi:hypothetical protein [Clostridium septicum]|uniref:Uncharacterized protein n=1 Tax=Clostridium septicum TaxID=1504 RepID=A0A9N7JLY4_CLOSE|nr:hypothetical protein [Clostridium septicum]AYE34177.1 hypothetical protein CP523_06675 [Clostridium septicum]MDU1315344.1 hypothetical protein [Clostridium septicum]QAS59540.1 hypothetical protein EI377_01140 [Clostridium septicum]UEC21194.1 hypothetical protein LK444_02105 [Clostridium septicum]USS00758.1 hypothetical protein NH397_14990 [Clostridium septicum]
MLEKLSLSDEEYDYLAKCIAIGVGIGTFVGSLIGNVILGFAAGGVIGIVVSGIRFLSHKLKGMHRKEII